MKLAKTTNGLMRHLRNELGINIAGSSSKKALLNMGYFHGFKGYRFIGAPQNIIPYTEFEQIIAVYQFDMNLKAMLYPQIMQIETAIKNYTLNTIIELSGGNAEFDYIYAHLLNDYKSENVGNSKYRNKMKSKLELRNNIYSSISYNYSDNKPVIQHYYHHNKKIPLWAIFEVINLGNFGFFLQCLNKNARIEVAKSLNVHSTSHNQNGRIVEDMVFLIKDLRNTIAHNGVVFDCRFKKASPPSRLKEYIQSETGINNVGYDNIVDYFITAVLILKKLSVSKTELRRFVRNLSTGSEHLRESIPISVHTSIMGSDFQRKIRGLTKYI